MSTEPTYEELKQQVEKFDKIVLENSRLQTKLQKTRERLLGLAELSPTAMLVYQDDRFIYGNKATETISGYSTNEISDMKFWDFVHPDYRTLVREHGQKRQRGEEAPKRYEFKIITKDGLEKWVDLAGAVTTIGGRPAGVVSVTDINDRKEMEADLRASEEKYRLLAETATDVIITLDEKLHITYVSPAVKPLAGYTVEESLTKSVHELLTPASYEYAMKVFIEEMEIEAGKSDDFIDRIRTLELEIVCKDGSTKWTEIIFNPIRNKGKKIVGLLGLSRDITDRRRAEEERIRLISERENALSEIKILSGMLPICAVCKKIRNDEGYWEQIESYIRDHSGAEFTHGICPDCVKRYYPHS